MQAAIRSKVIISVAAVAFLVGAGSAAAQWSNARGGPERDGARTGTADLPLPQVKWRHDLGGTLGGSALWQIPDPVAPRIALATGGRIELKRWDDSLSWKGQLLGLTRILAAADIDGDGGTDILFATDSSVDATVVGYSPDGELVFTAEPRVLGRITTGARIVDLDGDGIRDLYITSIARGQDNVIAAAYRFPGGDIRAGETLYEIETAGRDYSVGFHDVIAELDGTPGLEILALGHRSFYTYDAASGELESTSQLSGVLPYARATTRLVDLDRDGISEVFFFSNQAWSEANNRRHVSYVAHSAGRMTEIWSRNLGSSPDMRIAFSDTSIADLDSDGSFEVSFSVRNAAGAWTTEVRDAASGILLDTIIGERFEAVAQLAGSATLFTHDAGTPLRSYRFTRATGFESLAVHPDLRIVTCRRERPTIPEVPRQVPCVLPVDGVPQRGILAAEYDPVSNATTALVSLDSQQSFDSAARFDARGGSLGAVIEIGAGHTAVIAVAHSDGILLPLDDKLRFLPPSPKPPFSWAGVRYGSRFSGVDLPGFPLVLAGSGSAERIVALSGSGQASLLDATFEPSVVAGIENIWSAGHGSRVVVDQRDGDSSVVTIDSRGDITALAADTGEERWRHSDAFGADRPLHSDPLVFANPESNQSELWFHRRNADTGFYDLTAVDLATGQIALEDPNLDSNDSGWKRLALANWDGVPAPISGRLNQIWRFDLDGGVAAITDSSSSSFIVPITRAGQNPLFVVDGRLDLSVYDPTVATTLWTIERINTRSPRRGATLNVGGRPKYATSDSNVPVLRSVDVESGAIDFDFHLIDGQLVDRSEPLPTPTPLLGNVTAVTDLTGAGDPAYLVGSTDGFIYAIHASTGELLWALFVAAQVGEIVPADWDGDQLLELVASTSDGKLLGIDRFTGNAPAWVNDTNGISTDDIDELETEDTLFVAWAAVSGASSYEVAVFENDRTPITAGFIDAGDRTEMAISNLDLTVGTRYVVSVRAISSLGVSPDEPSDGVTIIDPIAEGPSPGGCCQVGGSPLGLETLLLVAFCLVLTRRRSRGAFKLGHRRVTRL